MEFNQAFVLEGPDRPGPDHQSKTTWRSGKQAALHHRRAGGRWPTAGDTDALHTNGWINKDWQKRLPHNSAPYTSDHRAGGAPGQPRASGLGRPHQARRISVITPNPKTSGGARWNYLARGEFAQAKYGGDAKAKDFVTRLYANVPVLDTGARGSSVTFAQQPERCVHQLGRTGLSAGEGFGSKVDVVYPSLSIPGQAAVTVVDKNVDEKEGARRGGLPWYLYTEEGGTSWAGIFYRQPSPRKPRPNYAKQFPALQLFTIDAAFGGWERPPGPLCGPRQL